MGLLSELSGRHSGRDAPFLIREGESLSFADVIASSGADLSGVGPGDVVALIGDFESRSILSLLHLIDLKVVLVPLTVHTRTDHEYFFDAAGVDVVVEGGSVRRIREQWISNPILDELRERGHPGLVLFSSGTTGRPKAILHDFSAFLERFGTPRPTFRTLNFLLFDHIGGINTLFHTLYNSGVVIAPRGRTPEAVLQDIRDFEAELLPTTPTFLRMMMLSGLLDDAPPPTLKVVTYGTERMDQGTLDALCALMPDVDFRQTYGMSELGILRVKSRERNSLWMRVGGEGVETAVVDGVLKIKAENRMLGYLNAPPPFDAEGWYDTKDIVEQDGEWICVVGRNSEVISVGGVKFLPSEVERVALMHPAVAQVSVSGVDNPITGQHVELICQLRDGFSCDKREMRTFFKGRLPEHMRPHRTRFGDVAVGHRFKRK